MRNLWLLSTLFLTTTFHPNLSLLAETEDYSGVTEVNRSPEAERFMDRFMAESAREAKVPGAIVAIVQNGEIILLKGYGDARLADGKKVDPATTIFRVGSISKTFVGLGILQMIQKGELNLDQDVGEILPELAVKFEHPVTIRNLVTHTAGFDEKLIGLGAAPEEKLPPLKDIVTEQYPGQIAIPGTYYNYSNYGYLVLAAVLEVVSQQPFASYQNEKVLGPLGMEAAFLPEEIDQDSLSASYFTGMDDQRVEMQPMRLRYFPVGSVYGTGQDMARYLQALTNGFSRSAIIDSASFSLLTENQFRPNPELNGTAFTFYERDLRGLRMLEHGGDWEAFSSLISFSPENKTGIFFSTNGSADPMLREELMQSFADFLGLESDAEISVTQPELPLENYTGSYRYARYEHFGLLKVAGLPMQVDVSVEQDHLLATFPAEFREPIKLLPVGGHVFASSDPVVKIAFRIVDGKSVGVSGTYLIPFYLERISPLEGMQTVVPLTAFAVLSMLACLFLPVARKVYAKFSRKEAPDLSQEAEAEERKAFRLLIATAWAHVLFLLGTQIHMGVLQQQIVEGVPRSLEALLYLPYGLLLLTILLAIRIPKVWNAYSWGAGTRMFYTLVAAAGVAFFQLLWYWNLIAPVR